MSIVVAKNTLSQLLGRGISTIAMMLVTFVVARQFGATGYGDFVKITTYIAFFYLLADFGVNAIFLQQDERIQWPTLVLLRVSWASILVAIAIGILALLPGNATQGYTSLVRIGILFFSPTIIFQAIITTANAIFQKRLRYELATWAIFFGSVVTVFFLLNATTLFSVITAVLVGTLVTAVFSFLFAHRLVGHVWKTPTVDQVKRLIVPTLPLGVTLLFNLVYFRADSFILTITRPTAEVGIYGLAYKVFEVVLVFPTFFMNAVYPMMLVSPKELQRKLRKSIQVLLPVSFLALGVVWVAAPLLVFIKNDFAASIAALRVLALGLPFFFLSAATMWALIARKQSTTLAVIYGICMIVNVVGNLLFVPRFGYMAASWITVATEALVLVVSSLVLKKLV